jgi:hypothetical protein
VINIRKSDGTIILGAEMGPSRLEMELETEGVKKDHMAKGCIVHVLQFSNGMARLVEGNFSGPDYILGKERDFRDAHLADGWYVMVLLAPPKNAASFYGAYDTWEQAEALADKLETVIWGAEQKAGAANGSAP